jgi:hypothetical protein
MWVSPNHPDPPRHVQPDPPDDDGQPLGTFPRGAGRDELRVTLKTFEGRPYVALRVWSRDERSAFWPVKGKGLSVRVGEVAGVIAALQRVAHLGAPGRPTDRAGGAHTSSTSSGRRTGEPDWRATVADLPRRDQAGAGAGFDEFGPGPDPPANPSGAASRR